MSSAAAAADAAAQPSPPKSRKKLLLIALAALLVLALGGGGAAFYAWKQKQAALAAEAEDGEGESADAKEHKADASHVPSFMPLDTFTVNLADRGAERYAQVGVTLELRDGKQADRIKAYMPAIRNNILLVIGDKTAAQLMDRSGKAQLADEIRRAALKPLGISLPEAADDAASAPAAKKRVKSSDGETPPIVAVHFSNFIIQ